jgi:hypothetical protein
MPVAWQGQQKKGQQQTCETASSEATSQKESALVRMKVTTSSGAGVSQNGGPLAIARESEAGRFAVLAD